MKVRALKNFTLAGESHKAGDVFEVPEERGLAWIGGKFVERLPEDDEVLQPETERAIERAEDDEDSDDD